MKRNVRKKILLLTVCTMIVGALLLTGCRPPNEIDDPWLKLWKEVVIDRDVKVTSVAFDYYTFQPEFSRERVISNDKKQISQLLDKLSAVGSDFIDYGEGDGTTEQCAIIGQYCVIAELYTENNNSLELWLTTSLDLSGYHVSINKSAEFKSHPDDTAEPLYVQNEKSLYGNFQSYSVFVRSDQTLGPTSLKNMISIFYADQ